MPFHLTTIYCGHSIGWAATIFILVCWGNPCSEYCHSEYANSTVV